MEEGGPLKKLWFKIRFYFAREQTRIEGDGITEVVVVFKRIGDIDFILRRFIPPPLHYNCRCSLEPIDNGTHKNAVAIIDECADIPNDVWTRRVDET